MVAGSEAGLVDLDPERIIHSGRLGPGEMLVADLDAHQLLEDDQLLKEFDRFTGYGKLVADTPLEPAAFTPAVDDLTQLQLGFWIHQRRREHDPETDGDGGQGRRLVDGGRHTDCAAGPHAAPGLRFSSRQSRPVTNPPIDSLREAIVIKLHTRLGPWPHILNTRERPPGLVAESPFLSL